MLSVLNQVFRQLKSKQF